MNYKTLFAVASMASVLFFSCQRESINEDSNALKPTSQAVSELTNKVNQRVNKKLSAASDAEMFEKFDAAKMVVLKNTKSTLSSEETPLEDIFYVYEGLFNNQFANYLANIEGLERIEMEVSLPVEIGENENYFVHNSILSDFYNNLANQISVELLNDPKKILYFCDFSLKNLDRERLTANIGVGVSIGLQNNEFFSPASPYYACGALGPCNANNPGYDAADFINVYANATAAYKLNNPCPSGTNIYPVATVGFESYDFASWPITYNQWFNNVYPYYWKGESNDCLGNTNQEWQNLYADFDILRNYAIHTVQNDLGMQDYEFIIAYYHSHIGQSSSNPTGIDHYHGGTIGLGKVFCQ